LFVGANFVALSAMAQEKKPNVVFILADNVGYGDLGPYGGGELRSAPFAQPLHHVQGHHSRSFRY
jgi:arylsulfatase A-like enzyme